MDNTGTDDQNIANLAINTTSNVLTVGIENGISQTVDLSHLDNTGSGSDNQNLSITVDSLLIENGSGVKLSDLGTDNQNISNLAINTTSNILTVGIEDGISQTVDLTHLDNTGTDDQNIANLAINTTSNVLTVGIEDGISQTIDLTHLDDAGTDDQKIDSLSLIGSFLSISLENDGEAAKKVNLSALSSDGWKLSGNSATSPGTDFLGTTDAQDLVIKTNNVERFRVKNDGSRALFANPGDFSTPGLSPTAVLGIDGTDHARLRLTAGNAESYDDSKGASIDLHGNTSTVNKGVLDLVAGSAANGSLGAIKFWTNTNGSSQQTSAVITGSGDMGIGTTTPSQKLDVNGEVRVRSLAAGSTSDEVVVADAFGVLKKVSQTQKIQTLTASGFVDPDTDILLVTPSSATTVNIPPIGVNVDQFPVGFELKIKRTNAEGNDITLSPTFSTIDGQATRTLNVGYQSITLVATSSGWYVID